MGWLLLVFCLLFVQCVGCFCVASYLVVACYLVLCFLLVFCFIVGCCLVAFWLVAVCFLVLVGCFLFFARCLPSLCLFVGCLLVDLWLLFDICWEATIKMEVPQDSTWTSLEYVPYAGSFLPIFTEVAYILIRLIVV